MMMKTTMMMTILLRIHKSIFNISVGQQRVECRSDFIPIVCGVLNIQLLDMMLEISVFASATFWKVSSEARPTSSEMRCCSSRVRSTAEDIVDTILNASKLCSVCEHFRWKMSKCKTDSERSLLEIRSNLVHV